MSDIIIQYHWQRARLVLPFILFSIMLVVFLMLVRELYTGTITPSSSRSALLFSGGRALLLTWIFAIYFRMLGGPPFLTIYQDGRLDYQEVFKRYTYRLDSGSRISLFHKSVVITTGLSRIGRHKSKNGTVSVSIPPSVRLVKGSPFVIGQGDGP